MSALRSPSTSVLADLRNTVACLQSRNVREALPFGITAVDGHLPNNGLALGALHEISDGGAEAWRASLSPLFAAGILARLKGPVLWCLHSRDLFAPAIARVGLKYERIIYCETWKDAEVLPAMEEGLRYKGFAGVVGELSRLPLTASRRLQLAAEKSGVTAFAIRRTGAERDEANAAFSRWRIGAEPSAKSGRGLGRARWKLELLRCRGAEAKTWIVEACDAKGRIALSAQLSNGLPAPEEQRRASA